MFTLLMSVYARENPAHLHAALASIAHQDEQPAEFLLVEDGPLGQGLVEVIAHWQSRLNIVSLRLPQNVGLSHALNAGLAVAREPWVMRFDTDDVSVVGRVARQRALAAMDSLDLFGAQTAEFETDPSHPIQSRTVPTDMVAIRRFAERRNPFNHNTVCYRTELARQLGGYPHIPFMEDYGLWLRMIAAGARVSNSPDVEVLARIGNGLVARRGGWRYVRSEWQLQALMARLKFKPLARCLSDGAMRSAVFMAPVAVRENIYRRVLRNA